MPVNIRWLISRSPAVWVRAWLRVLGPPFIALTIVISLLGAAITFGETRALNVWLWILSAAGLVCIHFGTSCLNDYFDFLSGTDNINPAPTVFSGGSRVIQEGALSPKALLAAGSLFVGIGSAIGLYLFFQKGPLILLLGAIGVFLAVGYVHPKINLSKIGLGELAVGFAFGPIMLSGVYYVQSGAVDYRIILTGFIMGILAASVLWINQIPDYEADKATGKTNWAVRLGKKKASRAYAILIGSVYALTAILIFQNVLPRPAWVVFVTLPLAVKAARIAVKKYNEVENLLPANALTIAVTLIYGALLSFIFIL